VSVFLWQFDRQRRRRPLAFFYDRDFSLLMNSFVVTFEIVEPNCASGRNLEGGGFVWNPLSFAEYEKPESYTVIESAGLDRIARARRHVSHFKTCSVAMVDGFGMNSTHRIPLVETIRHAFRQSDTPGQIHTIHDHRKRRWLDHRATFE